MRHDPQWSSAHVAPTQIIFKSIHGIVPTHREAIFRLFAVVAPPSRLSRIARGLPEFAVVALASRRRFFQRAEKTPARCRRYSEPRLNFLLAFSLLIRLRCGRAGGSHDP